MSVTAPAGFTAAGVAAGVAAGHKPAGAPDLALVVNEGPSLAAAGVVTTNRVKGAPVLWTEQVLRAGAVSAVLLDSGCANACTGPLGFQDTHAAVERAARALDRNAAQIAVAATGPMGVRPALDRLLPGIDLAAGQLSEFGGERAARAIMTTDTQPKTAAARGGNGDGNGGGSGSGTAAGWTVGGMAKGGAMLAPSLATLLVVLTTDAEVPAPALDRALRAATRATFERIDADGVASPNDTVLLLASGASQVTPDADEFAEAVHAVCADLARQLVKDADGATKEIRVEVTGAAGEEAALTAARAVAGDALVKAALRAEDPAWPRVVAAVGASGVAVEPHRLAVAVNGVQVCRGAAPADDPAAVDLRFREVTLAVDLGAGDCSATVWTTDATAAAPRPTHHPAPLPTSHPHPRAESV
ncbi:bifunctional ornithine acetyltransferase/N-acetylglutamate synthase [Streptomyces sp. 3MP-14]|uniref:Arginine biosynthesis bifunctional protein ArgJ n=1 Tax=Streptomyces mimosae TaxID=2586635 RepID=A0A5N6A4B2_9ACTN|nr:MULTISPECIES: bifunctional ornithine acetyltransferase/N-acetylglutamate synthase [Streptomyces]KAB8162540.1 bifunctional ornithine acetyltransferase/N-acetylglutamate synthase [Streptomyces mimosae]KAB8174367.1 bifunctional ornithine acetyltransferase/N-acetylglutamate synthase [Streptomyces sp. 3MP-14]